jgi:hypothetical protein
VLLLLPPLAEGGKPADGGEEIKEQEEEHDCDNIDEVAKPGLEMLDILAAVRAVASAISDCTDASCTGHDNQQ